MYKSIYLHEIILGWLLSSLFCIIGIILKRRAIGQNINRFFMLFGVTILRSACFLGIIFLFIHQGDINIYPLICAIFVAYFTFLAYDITKLHFYGVKS